MFANSFKLLKNLINIRYFWKSIGEIIYLLQTVDLNKIRSNLILSSLIAQDSAELSHYCGIDPSLRHRMDEEREAQAIRAQALRMQTEALLQQNAQAQANRDRAFHAGVDPATHRRHGD